VKSNGFSPPAPPGNRGANLAIPARHPGTVPGGLGTARFTKALELKKRPTRRVCVCGRGCSSAPKPTTQTASGSHRIPNTLGQIGEKYGPSIALFARARCPSSPLLRPYSPGGAARGSHTGQFSCFGPRSCFIAFVLDIPNGFWPLDRAVGRA
jgi:hypothetical protein